MTTTKKATIAGIGFVLAAATMVPAAHAQGAADFYKGKSINLIVASGAGGGYDAYARSFARHVSKHIPGAPTIVPKNMPGAGGLIAANYLFNVAPADGLTIGALTNGVAMDPLFGNAAAKFDPRKGGWLGSIGKLDNVCVSWAGGPETTIEKAKTQEVIVGGASASSNSAVIPALVNEFIGTKFKIVTGYKEGTGMTLALENGEVQAICGLSWSTLKARNPDWVKQKKLNIFLQIGLKKSADLQSVPNLLDLMTNADDKAALTLALVRQETGRPYVTPPGVQADRLAVLRTAFDATVKDPEFVAEAEKLLLDIDPLTGAEIDHLIADAYTQPKPIIERASKLIEPGK